jgi:hypothetical protein
MGMLQGHIRNTQWKADLFQPALYHSKWTIGIGAVALRELSIRTAGAIKRPRLAPERQNIDFRSKVQTGKHLACRNLIIYLDSVSLI